MLRTYSLSRRQLFRVGGAAGVTASLAALSPWQVGTRTTSTAAAQSVLPDFETPSGDPAAVAADSAFWRRVAAHYGVTNEITNFENGYWGIMALPVLDAYKGFTDHVNLRNSYFARTEYGSQIGIVYERLAEALGVATDELVLTRNASEALQILIGGYNRLEPGDTVMYCDLDYDAMQYAMEWLKDRRGVDVIKFDIPEPATRQSVLDAYEKALTEHPETRLLLTTHISHRTGLMMPIAEIAEMARSRDVDVICDAAHSWGQVDFQIADLGVDFMGFNLHKWIGAPIGAGLVYIKKDRLQDIDVYMADGGDPESISSRAHTGTINFACHLAIPAALEFHQKVGPKYKEARIRFLRDAWVSQVSDLPNLEILTPDDPTMYAGITSFRIKGRTTREENAETQALLRDEYGIMTVVRTGVAAGAVIRVTPALYNREEDCDRLAVALREIAAAN